VVLPESEGHRHVDMDVRGLLALLRCRLEIRKDTGLWPSDTRKPQDIGTYVKIPCYSSQGRE